MTRWRIRTRRTQLSSIQDVAEDPKEVEQQLLLHLLAEVHMHASRRVRGGQARRGQAAKAASQSDPDGCWSEKDEGKLGTEIPEFKLDDKNSFWQHLKSFNTDSPLQFDKEMMMPDDFTEQVVEQSRLYAEQHKNKSWSKRQTEVTVDNLLRVVEGIMLLSGYNNNLPSRRLYWEQRDDVYNKTVAC